MKIGDVEVLLRQYSDGCQQYTLHPDVTDATEHMLALERVVRKKSRRKNWMLVDRGWDASDALYPPKVAGPFPTLEAGIAALVLLRNTHSQEQ
jgi:hypothetical protein